MYQIVNTSRDKLHAFFANNYQDFEGLDPTKIKGIMVNIAIKELEISAEEIYEYVEDFDVDFFAKKVYN